MAGIELCKFTHGLGLYIRILPRAIYTWAGPLYSNFTPSDLHMGWAFIFENLRM